MSSTPFIFNKSDTGAQSTKCVFKASRPAPLECPDFVVEPTWTRFLADWCESDQQIPQIGFQGNAASSEIVARHEGLVLRSVFQPIFSASQVRPVAFEALVRAQVVHSGKYVTPDALFQVPETQAKGVLLDRICRLIHLLNFERQASDASALYLNVSTGHLQTLSPGQHGSFLGAAQSLCRLPPSRVILEILETEFDDRDQLGQIVQTFKDRGHRVAIDDFGARHSNFDRLWALSPDVVKIDRELLLQADNNPRVRKILPKLVEIIHELDAHVVCEGIETAGQHALAVQSGVDLVQGFFFARPARDLIGR